MTSLPPPPETALDRVSIASIEVRKSIPADQHPVTVFLAGFASHSRRTMRNALLMIVRLERFQREGYTLETLPWWALRFQHTNLIRADLMTLPLAPATMNLALTGLRGVLKTAWRLNLMTSDEFNRAIDLPPIKGTRVPKGRHASREEIRQVLEGCTDDPRGVRDRAMIALAYGAGLRRGELVGLDIAHFRRTPPTLIVRGKGNKERALPVAASILRLLDAWIDVRGPAEGPLFVSLHGSRRHRLSTQTVFVILQKYTAATGIERLSPHDLRRSFIGESLDRGADIATVQKLAGHASVATTGRYDRRSEKVTRAAVEKTMGGLMDDE
jgi:site-specific recombinase XerC